MAALDPTRPVGDQVAETLVVHRGPGWRAARTEALDRFRRVRMSDPGRRMKQRPSGLSGGMLQRVVLAAAIACRPALLIAGKPAIALDASVATDVLQLLADLRRETWAAMIFIPHDISVVRRIAHRVLVLRHGRWVETGDVDAIPHRPTNSDIRCLLESARPAHRSASTAGPAGDPVLSARNLGVSFPAPSLWLRAQRFVAVDGVSLEISRGRTLALVEQGDKLKTTLARAIAGLQCHESGIIRIGGRQRAQFVFQNPQIRAGPDLARLEIGGRAAAVAGRAGPGSPARKGGESDDPGRPDRRSHGPVSA